MTAKFRIGSIARCIGLKGEVAINPDTFDIRRFLALKSVYVGHTDEITDLLTVENVRIYKERPIVKFVSIDSRDDAEKIVGRIVYVDETERIELPEGHLFIHEIIGMDVYTVGNEYVGSVIDVLSLPAHNVYVISSDGKKEVMIPAVDEFIDSIDAEHNSIRIKPIEGLLE
jgi:16S rRNA processing protein RimM